MKLSDFRLSTLDEIEAQPGRGAFPLADKTVGSAKLPSLAVFYLLQERFGTPEPRTDSATSQWGIYLRGPDAYFDIYDYKQTYCMIDVYEDAGDEKRADEIGRKVVALLEKQAAHQLSRLKKRSEGATTFVLQNPYLPYYQSATSLLEKAVAESGDASDYCRSAFFLFVASFEGLLNLAYQLYLKPVLRDERIAQRLSREQLDVKLRLAPVYCSCFSADAIDHNSDAFKRFHTIVNLRNDFIHANITQAMNSPIVIEDGYEFVLDRKYDAAHRSKNILSLTPGRVASIKAVIDQMIAVLSASMKPKYRSEFRKAMQSSYIRVTLDEGEMILE